MYKRQGLYFVNQMLKAKGIDIKGKTVAVSGFGNVAWGAVTKATELGAKMCIRDRSSGNQGFALTGSGYAPNDFPTSISPNGHR